jgi:hypothetical protein
VYRKRKFRMTTYSYDLTLNDSEAIMLKSALKLMIEMCEINMTKGEGAPNWAHKKSAENVLFRLHDNIKQSSGNNFSLRSDASDSPS